ncbi:MAG: DUF4355 domain-containing protein [Christensenellales bacterium]|jgi:hypothetical protein
MKENRRTDAKADLEQQVAQAVERARAEWEAAMPDRLDEARAAGERAAGMSAQERLIERERQLQGRERELSRRELRAAAIQALSARGLPSELADAINLDDREAYERSLEGAERAFRSAVQAGVAQRLGGQPPAFGAEVGDPSKMTDDQYYAGWYQGKPEG